MIISHANHGGLDAIWISDLFEWHLGYVSHLRFLAYNFLLKRDTATGIVSLFSTCQDVLTDIHLSLVTI